MLVVDSLDQRTLDIKFPILIPGRSHLAELIIRHCHNLVFHQGRGMTLNCIRQSGFFIFEASSLISRIIYKSVRCNRFRSSNLFQTCRICQLNV